MAGVTVRTGWSRHRLLTGLLIVSAVLNAFFIGGALWIRLHPPPEWPPHPGNWLGELRQDLDLTPQQRTAFQQYSLAMRERNQLMRQEVGPLIANAWEEIGKPAPDHTKIDQFFDEAAERRRLFQRDITKDTLTFLSALTPAQRDKFLKMARERRPPWTRDLPPAH
ncbi:MAG: periplasmic heavy metal sensor [Alphaproteobacteria bacterium]|nr:periplasmic heavy metal sensor [Alphaproteobacteria bacterium]